MKTGSSSTAQAPRRFARAILRTDSDLVQKKTKRKRQHCVCCHLPCVFLSSCPSAVPTSPPLPGTMPCGMPAGTDPGEASVAPGHRTCPERTHAQTLQRSAVSCRALSALIYTDHSIATLPSVGSHDGIFPGLSPHFPAKSF